MTSPPDVQNVPDVWGLLERAHDMLIDVRPFAAEVSAALRERDRFVLVPNDHVAWLYWDDYAGTRGYFKVCQLDHPREQGAFPVYAASPNPPEGK